MGPIRMENLCEIHQRGPRFGIIVTLDPYPNITSRLPRLEDKLAEKRAGDITLYVPKRESKLGRTNGE